MLVYDCGGNTRSLYIHWPFCPYKCQFCPFVALSGQDHLMERYTAALTKEIKIFAAQHPNKLSLDTIYIGGGTPSTWPNRQLLDTFGILKTIFCFDSISEITLEANPGTVREEQIPVWKEAGITRISIGVQSLNDSVLAQLNRHQKASEVRQLISWTAGKFDGLSIDIIIGLPGVSDDEWRNLIHEIGTWPVDHISMYFLMVHENTPLYKRVSDKDVKIPPDDETVDLYYWSVAQLAKYGFEQYEVSSFAKKGKQAQHNQIYWERKPYKGFGIGACSFDGTRRIMNEKVIHKYLKNIEQDQSVAGMAEKVSDEQILFETIMLGIRRMKGLSIEDILQRLSKERQEKFLGRVKMLKDENYIYEKNGRLFLAPTALALENEIAVRLSV